MSRLTPLLGLIIYIFIAQLAWTEERKAVSTPVNQEALTELRDELKKLPRNELLRLVRYSTSPPAEPLSLSPDERMGNMEYQRHMLAFDILTEDNTLTAAETRELLQMLQAGDCWVSRLRVATAISGPVYESTATAEDKARADVFINVASPWLQEP